MVFKNSLIVVTDIDKSVIFYREALGLKVILDFGANKTLNGGLCLQTEKSYQDFIDGRKILYGGMHLIANK